MKGFQYNFFSLSKKITSLVIIPNAPHRPRRLLTCAVRLQVARKNQNLPEHDRALAFPPLSVPLSPPIYNRLFWGQPADEHRQAGGAHQGEAARHHEQAAEPALVQVGHRDGAQAHEGRQEAEQDRSGVDRWVCDREFFVR